MPVWLIPFLGKEFSVLPQLQTNAEAKAPILWPPDGKSPLIGKDPDVERLKVGGIGGNKG